MAQDQRIPEGKGNSHLHIEYGEFRIVLPGRNVKKLRQVASRGVRWMVRTGVTLLVGINLWEGTAKAGLHDYTVEAVVQGMFPQPFE